MGSMITVEKPPVTLCIDNSRGIYLFLNVVFKDVFKAHFRPRNVKILWNDVCKSFFLSLIYYLKRPKKVRKQAKLQIGNKASMKCAKHFIDSWIITSLHLNILEIRC